MTTELYQSLYDTFDKLVASVSPEIDKALKFAIEKHSGQVRKYTGEPYVTHPVDVACMVLCVGGDLADIIIALLHDVVEDCDCTLDEIESHFGMNVRLGVADLTEDFPGAKNRAERKELYRRQLAAAPSGIQTIKLADLISNVPSIVEHDPSFARVYLREKQALFDEMTKANWQIRQIAKVILADAEEKLGVAT
jgi:(p)ppGpp synthase/HD superfamily hydrolase